VVRRRGARAHVCIVVQNLPVPFDRRVWLECLALREAGFEVSVVCPKGPGDPTYHVVEGVHLHKYRPFPPITRQILFVAEYAWSILATFVGLLRVWRREPFRVVQLCNPPDVLWVAALPFKVLRRVKVVFDQHDLCPELYRSRFPAGTDAIHRLLLAAERLTYLVADRVVSTNESYRRKALERGRKKPAHVRVVRTGPDPTRMHRGPVDPAVRDGRQHLLAYLGVMGPQDGVDVALRAMHHIVHTRGRTDVALVLIGDGDAAPSLRKMARMLDLDSAVTFTGRIPDAEVRRILSAADVGLSPDPRNPLNDVSTMNKTMEYMAHELPVVAFDLVETRVSAQDAAVYARPNSPEDFGDAVLALLDDEPRRKEMGLAGRARVEDVLAWRCQVPAYVNLYRELIGTPAGGRDRAHV